MRKPIFQDPVECATLAFLCALSTLGVAWTTGYLMFNLHALLTIGGFVAAALIVWTLFLRKTNGADASGKNVKPDLFFVVLTVLGDIAILATCLNARTDVALSSPWLVLSPAIFVLFAATTFAGMMSLSRIAAAFHFFTAFSVATIVFAIGFGFDPFIHRAAETALAAAGHIDPKTPLYAGQYAVIATLHRTFGFSTEALDKWFLPLLSSTLIPILGIAGLRDGWGLTDEAARRWVYLILVVPFAALTFTVPYNATVALFILIVCLWPLSRDRRVAFVLSIIAAWSVLLHPLLGIPTAIFVGYAIVRHRVQHIALDILAVALLAVSVPALFALNNYLVQAPTVFINPFSRLDFFFGLFADPFPQPPGTVPLPLHALYQFGRWWPFVLVIAFVFIARRNPTRLSINPLLRQTTVLFLGLLGSIFIISAAFEFKDIISYEQSEFALRMLAALPFLLLPTLCVGSEFVWRFVASRRPSLAPLVLVPFAAIATISFFFAYPQSNVKSDLSGPSVSAADVTAVRAIDALSKDEPYFVLANQMTSAAALQEFGFAHYLSTPNEATLWYPLPTGAPLYDFFARMTYGEPTIETMRAAAEFTGTSRGYFLVYRYWPGSGWLGERALGISDRWHSIDDGAILVYEFTQLLSEPNAYANED